MIKITIKETHDHILVQCLGHANYNVIGQDIVCSAVSTLLQTLAYSLEELTNDKINVSLESGKSFVAVYNPTLKSQLLVDSFFIGCREIADVYNDYVKVTKI